MTFNHIQQAAANLGFLTGLVVVVSIFAAVATPAPLTHAAPVVAQPIALQDSETPAAPDVPASPDVPDAPDVPEIPACVLPAACTPVIAVPTPPTPPTPSTPTSPVIPVTPPTPPAGPTTPTGPVEPTEPADPTNPTEPTQPTEPATLAAPLLSFINTPAADTANLTWTWTVTQPEAPAAPVAIPGYGYIIYHGGVVAAHGQLAAEATSLLFAAPQEGEYELFLWVLPVDATGVVEHCLSSKITYTLAPPVVVNGGFTQTGNTATPNLSTAEPGLTYAWSVTGPNAGVTISDTAVLNPVFTFSQSGAYTFTLVVSGAPVTSTIVTFDITYTAPPVVTPIAPIIPQETLPPQLNDYVRPAAARAAAQRTLTEATTPQDQTKDSTTSVTDSPATIVTDDTKEETFVDGASTLAKVVTPSTEGWKIVGIAWYWWILFAAIIASAWLWTIRTIRSRNLPDDV